MNMLHFIGVVIRENDCKSLYVVACNIFYVYILLFCLPIITNNHNLWISINYLHFKLIKIRHALSFSLIFFTCETGSQMWSTTWFALFFSFSFLDFIVFYSSVNIWLVVCCIAVMSSQRMSTRPFRRWRQKKQFNSLTGIRLDSILILLTSRQPLFPVVILPKFGGSRKVLRRRRRRKC